MFLFISCWSTSLAQEKDDFHKCKESRISEGTCYDIIEHLRINQDTDSIAVQIFKDEYRIKNMSYRHQEWLLKKRHAEIIRYFAQAHNKKFQCKLNVFINKDPVLLME